MAYDPSLGKTSEDFRFIFTDREAIGKNKQKIRSHLGPVPQVSGRWSEDTLLISAGEVYQNDKMTDLSQPAWAGKINKI